MKRIVLYLVIFLMIHPVISGQNNYELLYLKGDLEQILSTAQKKSSIEDYYWLSYVLNKKGKTLKAIEILEEGIKQYEDNQKLEILISEFYYETGNYPKAKLYIKRKYQNNPEIFMQLINILEFENNYKLAIELLKKKIVTDSMNIQYLSHLGDNYSKTDSIDLALEYYEKIFALNPEDQLTANKLANLYLKNKDFDKSIKVCDLVLKNDSTNKKFIKIKGSSSINKNDFITAETCFQFLLNNGDSGKFVLKHLGISEFKNASFHISREHLLMAYKQDSNDFEICYFLGNGFLNSPTPEKGLFYFNRIDSLLQPDPLVMSALYIEKQSIYSTLNKHNDALRCYKIAYKYNPKPEYLFYIASLYQNNLKNNQKALDYYNLFLEKLPPKPDSEHKNEENQFIISLRKVAENNITRLKEELFFNGKLQNKN
jgi:tetratricopeptide (TPR) repeat protein